MNIFSVCLKYHCSTSQIRNLNLCLSQTVVVVKAVAKTSLLKRKMQLRNLIYGITCSISNYCGLQLDPSTSAMLARVSYKLWYK